MDIKKYLREQIKKCRDRMNLAKCIDCGILFAAAGGVPGMLCELASLVWPFYYAHLAAGLCFAAGLLTGVGYAVYRRADMSQAARRIDSFGLKERMITAYELLEQPDEEELARLQRQDALIHYDQLRDRIRIPLSPDRRHVLALFLSVALVTILGVLPSPVREQAGLRHQVQEQAKEELEELEELVDALEGVDMESLTEEQRAQLQELMESMQRSGEELARADTWESLGSATERLDYKYGQARQSLEQLAGQLENPEAAGVASAQELAQAASPNGTHSGQAAVSPGNSGGDGSGSQGAGDNDGNENGDGSGGQGTGNENGDGSGGQGAGDGAGNGSQGAGEGSGDGSGGQGAGDGAGNGSQGAGESSGDGSSGQGTGSGNGRGTGSSNAAHDYVSIPNAIADDPSLTGEKYGDQNSDYYRQQNGLAWEGEHVNYSSVIGQYTDSAYEGIASGKYPTGMESVIREYFENLNK